MARTFVCALFVLVLVPNAFGGSPLRPLNDGVSRINELIKDINDVRDDRRAYELSMRKAILALKDAAKLLEQMRLFLRGPTRVLKDDSHGRLKELSMEFARRSLTPAEGQETDSEKDDAEPEKQEAIKISDDAPMNVEELPVETKVADSAANTTIKPPEFFGPSLSGQQLFNNLFYEAMANTMREKIKQHPNLRKELGTDWDPITLMKHKKPR